MIRSEILDVKLAVERLNHRGIQIGDTQVVYETNAPMMLFPIYTQYSKCNELYYSGE